jgi:uracil-DNA glycosylase
MTLLEIQQKLHKRLKPSGWADVLKAFILSKEFYEILENLHEQTKSGDRRFTPVIKDLFRAFEECPWDKLRVVMIGQDPYPKLGVADGISFSCSKTMKEQPSLRYMFNALQARDPDYIRNPDLKRWSNQGILMLNTALTCQVGNIGAHINLWEPFTSYLMEVMNERNTGLVYVLLGNKAKAWENYIDDYNKKLYVSHPASAAYQKERVWNDNNIWDDVNNHVTLMYGEDQKIEW